MQTVFLVTSGESLVAFSAKSLLVELLPIVGGSCEVSETPGPPSRRGLSSRASPAGHKSLGSFAFKASLIW